ncbi:hypothetical protein ACFVXC_16605 [Streptomyces sp. NPDC058257]|uniref:hypothetical protein n=1 Tax=Streptomyces sp. NPDC058257 TaxID=3346409 RepID=UPI0036DFA956
MALAPERWCAAAGPLSPPAAAIGDRWVPLAAGDTYVQGLRAFVDDLLAHVTPTPLPDTAKGHQ